MQHYKPSYIQKPLKLGSYKLSFCLLYYEDFSLLKREKKSDIFQVENGEIFVLLSLLLRHQKLTGNL